MDQLKSTDRALDKAFPAELTLAKAHLDLSSVKTQLIIGIILTSIVAFTSYFKSIEGGFLLDDFLHLNLAARALHGDPDDFLQNFTGNWAGSDFMKSYRPLVSLSFLTDYLLFKGHAFGFHLTNILLLVICAALVGLISLELTGRSGNRLGAWPAVWAALLFAAYPLHPEAVSWVIGRVDLLCTAFFLASVFCYLRFRLVRESQYLYYSLAGFALSLASKEMAVTLPMVLTLAELFLFQERKDISLRQRLSYLGAFWGLLAVFALFRSHLLGTVVGGYGSGTLEQQLLSWRNFLDLSTVKKILYPLNEEVSLAPAWWSVPLTIAYGVAGVILSARLGSRTVSIRPFAFLLLWALVGVLPAYQIWHIYPNLSGSRLFFLSSAPLCILLAMVLLPALDRVSSRAAKFLTVCGTLALAVLFLTFCLLLNLNNLPWATASARMQSFKNKIAETCRGLSPGQKLLLLNLPQDFSGAGMLTRPLYLKLMLSPPLFHKDLSGSLLTVEPQIAGSHEFLWPEQFRHILQDGRTAKVLIYNRESGDLESFRYADTAKPEYNWQAGAQSLNALSLEPAETALKDSNQWGVINAGAPTVTRYKDFLRLFPGNSGLTLYLPPTSIDPLRANAATVDATLRSKDLCPQCLGGHVQFVWQPITSASAAYGPGSALMRDKINGKYFIYLGRYRSWTFAPAIGRVGLKLLPGNYSLDLRSIRITDTTASIPHLSFSDGKHEIHTAPSQPVEVTFSTRGAPDARWVSLAVSQCNTTFDITNERDLNAAVPSHLQSRPPERLEVRQPSGKVTIPGQWLNRPGVYQARIIALNSLALPSGLPSEPVSIVVETPDQRQNRAPGI